MLSQLLCSQPSAKTERRRRMALQVSSSNRSRFSPTRISDCVVCLRCGTRDPGKGGWTQSYTLCSPCGDIYKEKIAPHKEMLLNRLKKIKMKRKTLKRKRQSASDSHDREKKARSGKKARTDNDIPKDLGPFGPSLLSVPWEKVWNRAAVILTLRSCKTLLLIS